MDYYAFNDNMNRMDRPIKINELQDIHLGNYLYWSYVILQLLNRLIESGLHDTFVKHVFKRDMYV